MRKLILLAVFFTIGFGAAAQVTIFKETFDAPSGPDSVTNGYTLFNPSAPPATKMWNDTNFLSTSPSMSYHVKGTQYNDIYFDTDPFSTVGYPYIFLTFNHISKFYLANNGRIDISTNGGTTWSVLDSGAYRGNSALFYSNNYFNEGAYQSPNDLWKLSQNILPQQSWWVTEKFDLRGYAYDTINNNGYTNVQLRFNARFLLGAPGSTANNPIFHAGWFVDDIEIIGSTCELDAPKVSFTGNGVCLDKPVGPVVQDPSNSYAVSVLATDKGAGMDRVELHYTHNGVMDTILLTLTDPTIGKYTTTIPNIPLGDTVTYFLEAYDLSCPNMTRVPGAFMPDLMFYVDSGYPAKCGSPFCGALPQTIKVNTLPWTETFEGTEWVAGNNGSSTINNGHRGTFPIENYWVVQPPHNTTNSNKFAWSIAGNNGPTSTAQTGPSSNHTPGGSKYLYTEGSLTSYTPGTNYSETSIYTPCIDLTNNTKCLAFEFYYHMFGSDMGTNANLRVDIDTGSSQAALYPAYSTNKGEQQKASTDPWKREAVDLTPFNGQFIRIRIVVIKHGSGEKYDIAIDDFKIYEPDPVDLEVMEYIAPINGKCSYSNNETVTIKIRNNGCTTTGSIPIQFQVNNNPVVNTTINANLDLGEDTIVSLSTGANLSVPNTTYNIKVWANHASDNNTSNDTVSGPAIEYNSPITNFPFFEDFEGGTKGTQNLGNTNWRFNTGLDPTFKWQVGEGLTPTRGTGPFEGYYYGGKYLYTETGTPGANNYTYFRSLCLDLSGMTNPTLDFFYHKNASDIGTVDVQVSLANQGLDTWTTITGSAATSTNTQEFSDWHFKRVNLSSYAGSTIKIRFRALRTGSTDKSDFAIDNIAIYNRSNTDAGVSFINTPGFAVPIAPGPSFNPQVTVTNFGMNTITNPNVTVEITPKCGTNPQTVTYTGTASGTIASGNSMAITLSSLNIAWPIGAFDIKVYTDITNDGFSFNDTVHRMVTGWPTYEIPFFDDFDDCNYSSKGFFQPNQGNTLFQWELGTPQITNGTIRNARSSPNAWATNLDGPYIPGTEEYLNAPLFVGFDTVVGTKIIFYQNIDFTSKSAGVLQYLAAGNQWKALGGDAVGFVNAGENWYGSKYGTTNSTVAGGAAWVTPTLGAWIPSSFPLYNFDRTSGTLRTRFLFKSDDLITDNITKGGWGIDDYEVFVPSQNSAAPVAVGTVNPIPFPYTKQNIVVTIENTGAKRLDSVQIEVVIDGVTLDGTNASTSDYYDFKPGITEGKRRRKDFDFEWPASSVSPGVHNVWVYTSRPNSFRDQETFNDTLDTQNNPEFFKFKIVVPDEIDMTSNGALEDCNDFEAGNGKFPWFTRSSKLINDTTEEFYVDSTSWEAGTPTQFVGAHSGNSAWSTYLDSNYMNFERSSLFTPVYIIDSGQVYKINFWHAFHTETNQDGGNMEVSFDGGLSWAQIGYIIRGDTSWYNTDYVTSLEVIKPGWSGNSKGWTRSEWTVMFGTSSKAVFRFRFSSDAEIRRPGWVIDDYCLIRDTTGAGARQYIGENEKELTPDDVIVTNLSPNPTSDVAELSLYLPAPEDVEINVVNSIGQQIENRSLKLDSGISKIDFNGSRWKAGMYIIHLRIGENVITRKLLIQ